MDKREKQNDIWDYYIEQHQSHLTKEIDQKARKKKILVPYVRDCQEMWELRRPRDVSSIIQINPKRLGGKGGWVKNNKDFRQINLTKRSLHN